MVTEKEIMKMMMSCLPECPLCGSDTGYAVTSAIRGHVQCKSCRTEWSSLDFVTSTRLGKLRVMELPGGVHSYIAGKQLIKRYEEHPIDFWASLAVAGEGRRVVPLKVGQVAEFVTVFAMALVVFLPGVTTLDIGWDEPVYVFAGRAYIEALTQNDFFGSVWQWNHEHPPLAKYLYGGFSLLLTPHMGNPYFAARVASSAMSALTVAITYLFASRAFGRNVGGLSAVLLASTPFYYGMSRYVSLDLPVAFLTCACIWMFYVGIEAQSATRILLSAVFFGLAGSVKTSGFTVLLVLLVWFTARFGSGVFKTINQFRKANPRFFLVLLSYPVVGAPLFLAVWPWLWSGTLDRLFGSDGVLTYASRFKAWGHEEFFEGRVVWHPPSYYYLYYLVVKTPIPTLLFFAVGVALLINGKTRRQSGRALILAALWFVVPLAIQTYQQPYDALRPVLSVFPPMAILSALGAEQTSSWVVKIIRQRRTVNSRRQGTQLFSMASAERLLVIAVLIIPSASATLTVRPLEIAYFNELAGDNTRILATFESSFWAEGLGEAVDYVNRFASPGASISVIGEKVAFDEFHREDLRIVGYVPPEALDSSNVEYVVFQGFYLQHFVWENRIAWGSTNSALDLWNYVQDKGSLVRVVKAGNAPLVWIFKV